MMVKVLRTYIALCVLVALVVPAADKMDKNYKAGSSESVKAWKPRTFENIKGTPGAYCIYIFDDRKANADAFHLEGKDCLGNDGVKAAVSKFIKVKVNNAAKGWDEQLMKDAEGGASLLLISDTMTFVFNKNTPPAGLNAAAIIAAAKAVQTHQDGLDKIQKARDKQQEKEITERMKKDAKEEAAAKSEVAIPGLEKKEPPKANKGKGEANAEEKKTVPLTGLEAIRAQEKAAEAVASQAEADSKEAQAKVERAAEEAKTSKTPKVAQTKLAAAQAEAKAKAAALKAAVAKVKALKVAKKKANPEDE